MYLTFFSKTNKHCQDGIQNDCGGTNLRIKFGALQNKQQTMEKRLNKLEESNRGKQQVLITRTCTMK